MRKKKNFRRTPSDIFALAEHRGSCIATDRITVDGMRVGYCYREQPSDNVDSGWRFFAGDETRGYADDARNYEVFDVNTIANYDPDVVPLLDEPIGSAFIRATSDGAFVRDHDVPNRHR